MGVWPKEVGRGAGGGGGGDRFGTRALPRKFGSRRGSLRAGARPRGFEHARKGFNLDLCSTEDWPFFSTRYT